MAHRRLLIKARTLDEITRERVGTDERPWVALQREAEDEEGSLQGGGEGAAPRTEDGGKPRGRVVVKERGRPPAPSATSRPAIVPT